jgi:pyruvate,water dikinase
MSRYIIPLLSILQDDFNLVGGKAINLGTLIENGFQVPSGIVVTTEAYDRFIDFNKLIFPITAILTNVNYSDPNSISEVSKEIQSLIRNGNLPPMVEQEIIKEYRNQSLTKVAVRSSAIAEDLPSASFAGQQSTYLNISDLNQILLHVRECYASLWSARTIAYRHKNKIPHQQVKIAVILQEMISAQSAGVLFTVNPISEEKTEMLIESTFGLGESLVSGQIFPDQFIVQKLKRDLENDFSIVSKEISKKEFKIENSEEGTEIVQLPQNEMRKSSLTEDQILSLSKIGCSIEEIFGSPQDIEWLYDTSNQLYITQTRPITALREDQIKSTDTEHNFWTRGYADDYWNDPTTQLFFDLLGTQLTLIVNNELNSIMGYPKISKKLLHLSHGHVYFNLDTLAHKIEYEIPTFLRNEDVLNYFPTGTGYFGKRNIKRKPFRLMRRISSEIRIMLHDNLNGSILKTASSYEEWSHQIFWPYCQQFDHELMNLPKEKCISQLLELSDSLERVMVSHFRMVRYGIPVHNIGMNLISQYLLKRFIGKDLSRAFYPILISGLQHKTSETNAKLYELVNNIQKHPELKQIILNTSTKELYPLLKATTNQSNYSSFIQAVDQFLIEYGDRGFSREMYYPRWRDEPEYVFDQIQALTRDFDSDILKKRQKTTESRIKVENYVAFRIKNLRFGVLKYKLFKRILSFARKYIIFRENQRFNLDKWITRNRAIYLEIGKILEKKDILTEKEDIFFLYRKEIRSLNQKPPSKKEKQKLGELVNERRDEFKKFEFTIPPKFIHGPLEFDDFIKSSDQTVFHGFAASQGIITASVRILTDIKQVSEVKAGEILVVPRTDPGWCPVFAKIGGLVTETGGILSHGAVVSREYGIPAVTNVFNACTIFQTGMKVQIDGMKGIIRILD